MYSRRAREGRSGLGSSAVCFLHQLGEVNEFDFFFGDLLDTGVEHDSAEGAGYGYRLGAGGEELFGPFVAGALVGGFFHPHAASAGAAAEGLFTVLGRLR